MEENKDIESVVEKSSTNSVEIKEEVIKPKKNKKSKSSVLRVIALVVLGLVVVFGILLIPFKSRTTLGRIFDVLGAHKLAMKTDAFVNRDRGVGNAFAVIDVKNEKSFEKAWSKIKKADLKFEAVSMKNNFSVYPANEQNKDSFKMNGKLGFNVSLKDQKAAVDVKFSMNGDGQKIKDLEDFGKVNMEMAIKGAFDNERAYFKIDNVNFKTKEQGIDMKLSFDDWYHTSSFEFSDEQKKALNEIAKLVTELTETKISQVVSDETGRQLSKMGYGIYDDIKVGGVKKVSFGPEGEKVEKKVREIDVKVNLKKFEEQEKEALADKYFDGIEKVVNDSTFQNYMKNDFYEWSNKLKPQVEILSEEKSDEEWSKEEWEKDFNDGTTEFNKNKEEARKAFKEEFMGGMSGRNANVSDVIEIMDHKVYLEPGTNDYYAVKEKIKIKPLAEDLDEMKEQNPEFYELFKDGMIVEFEVYDINFNEKVQPVEIPTNSKSDEEFLKIIAENKDAQNFSNFINGLMMSSRASGVDLGSESVIFPSENGMMFYYYDASVKVAYPIVGADEVGNVYYMDQKGQNQIVPAKVIKDFETKMNQSSSSSKNNRNNSMTDEEKRELEKME